MKIPKAVEKAYQVALKSRLHSYSPYSKFKVGAAVQFKGISEPVGGCNIENASYGATVCAERVALWSGHSKQGKAAVEFVVVVTAEKEPTVPCALCLQVLAEFSKDSTPIYLANLKGVQERVLLSELLGRPFRSFVKDV